MSGLGSMPRLDGPDLGRMGSERLARLRDQMRAQGVDGAVLLHGPHVTYATGYVPEAVDASHANHRRAVAVVGAATVRPGFMPMTRSTRLLRRAPKWALRCGPSWTTARPR